MQTHVLPNIALLAGRLLIAALFFQWSRPKSSRARECPGSVGDTRVANIAGMAGIGV